MAIKFTTMSLEIVDPPADVVTSKPKQDGIEVTLSTPCRVIRHLDGAFSIVAPSGVTVTDISPAPGTIDGTLTTGGATIDGLAVNGAMKNVQVGSRLAFDERLNSDTFDGALGVTAPVALSDGDILVCSKSTTDVVDLIAQDPRLGLCDNYASFSVVSAAPATNTFAVPVTFWAGRSGVTPAAVDLDAFVASLPSYSTANQPNIVDYDLLISKMRYAPVTWSRGGISWAYLAYQEYMPRQSSIIPNEGNFGREVNDTINAACLALISDGFTTAQKKAIATMLISWGIQWGDVLENTTVPVPEGGHFQAFYTPIVISKAARGLNTNVYDTLGGNQRGCFQYTQTHLDWLEPHTDITGPYFSRLRPITAVSGTNITLSRTSGNGTNHDPGTMGFLGMIMTSADKTRTATVVSGMYQNSNALTTISGAINAQPTPAFTVGENVYFQVPFALNIGEYEWNIREPEVLFGWNPMPDRHYRNNNQWTGQTLFLKATGLASDNDRMLNYVWRANQANEPAGYDLPNHHNITWDVEFWAEHAATIYA